MSEDQKKFNFFKSLKDSILKTDKESVSQENDAKKETDSLNLEDTKTLFVKSVAPSLKDDDTYKFKGISSAQDLDIKFAENFVDSGGKFIFAENMKEVFQFLESLKEENGWNHIFPVEFGLKNLMKEFKFQPEDFNLLMENADAAVSFCYSLSADEGAIILTPEEATNRRLVAFPNHHIIIAFKDQLKVDIEKAVIGFSEKFDDRLPSVLELYPEKPVARTYHKTLLSAEGPKNVYLFYIDAEIE